MRSIILFETQEKSVNGQFLNGSKIQHISGQALNSGFKSTTLLSDLDLDPSFWELLMLGPTLDKVKDPDQI